MLTGPDEIGTRFPHSPRGAEFRNGPSVSCEPHVTEQAGLAASRKQGGHAGPGGGVVRAEWRCHWHVAVVHDSQSQPGFSVFLMCAFPSCHPQIREQNLQDIKTAGPQSQVLCGVVMDRSLVQVRAQTPLTLVSGGSDDHPLQSCS